MHYCHVFLVPSTVSTSINNCSMSIFEMVIFAPQDLASEIILTLGQAFEVAYQLALRDGIATTPSLLLDNGSMLQGEYCGAGGGSK